MDRQRRSKNKEKIEEIINELEKTAERGTDESAFAYELYQRLLPVIKSVSRRYSNLDQALEPDDFLNEAYLAICDALSQYRVNRGNGKFSTYVYWHFQKRFENLCCDNKVVVLKNGHNQGQQSVMSYKEFQKIKRLLPEGTEWTVESRQIPFEPFHYANGDPKSMRIGNKEAEDNVLGFLGKLDEVTACRTNVDRDFQP